MALCVVAAAGGARAQSAPSARAEALFDDGNRLMADGKLAQACDAFEASNRLEPRAGTLISLGQCREQRGQLASAWLAYKQALVRVKDPRKRQFASSRVAELAARLSYLTISVDGDNRIAGLAVSRGDVVIPPAQWNQPAPVDGGDHVITARAPGREPWQTTVHVAATGARVEVEVPELRAASAPAAAPRGEPAPAGVADRAPTGRLTGPRKLALVLAGASVTGLVVGAALGVSANHQEAEAFRLCPDPAVPCMQAARSNTLIQSSHSRALGANAAFGVAAGAAIAAGVLWFTGAERAARVGVAPSLAPGAAGLVAWGRL